MSAHRNVLRAAAVALVAGLAAGPVAAAAPAFAPPAPVERTLDNGLRVVVFEDARLPIVQVRLVMPAGVAAERDGEDGLAHFTGQMLRRGAAGRSAAEFEAEMSALGAELTSTTHRDFIAVGAGFLREDFARGLALVADAATRPRFANEDIGRAHFDVARTLLELHQQPVATAEEQIWPLAFGAHPYGRPPAGTVPAILRITREELVAFHERCYRPRGSVLAVAGDVRAADVFEAARVTFAEWSGAAQRTASIVLSEAAVRPRVRIVDLATGARTELRVALTAPEHGSAAFLPVAIANRAFGEIADARLQRVPRGAGIAGGIWSSYAPLRDGGLWAVRAGAHTDSAGAAVAALRSAIADLHAHPPGEAEVEAAKRLHRATHPMELATLAGLLDVWSEADAHGLADEALRGYARGLDSLDAAAVAAAVRRWADPARLQILAVGPAERLRPQLEAFGEVEVVRLEGVPETPWATREPTEADRARGAAIVDAAARAHGGRDRIRGIKDSSLLASVTFATENGDVQGRLRQLRKEPFKFREEMESLIYRTEHVLDGAFGWIYDSQNERIAPADSMQMATLRSGFLSDVPHLMKLATEKDAQAIFRGREQADGRAVNVVEVRAGGDRQLWLLFDEATHHLVASDVRGGVPPQIIARRSFSDLREVNGVMLPFVEERRVQNRLLMRIEAQELAINFGIDDSAFGVPKIGN